MSEHAERAAEIDAICEALAYRWQDNSDMRLGQYIVWLTTEITHGKSADPFYLTDKEWLTKLEEHYG